MASDWLAAHPQATEFELRDGMTKIWDSIDNRLGQMVYDNLFWNKLQKDVAFLAVRAVGWNLGTIRELGGGATDLIRSAGRLLRGTGPADISLRTQYSIALPITVAINGAMLNYLYTGQAPQSLMDYFFPRTGRMRAQDNAPERVNIPSYVKDVVEYNRAPVGTLMNKLHPLAEVGWELYHNRDFYGDIITFPEKGDPVVQGLQYGLRTLQPFSIQGLERQAREGADIFPRIMNLFGFVPAPLSITDPARGARVQHWQDLKAWHKLQRHLRQQ